MRRGLALAAAVSLVAVAGCSGGGGAGSTTVGPATTVVANPPAGSNTGSVPAPAPAIPSTVAGVTAGLAEDDIGLAAQLVAAERTIRDPGASPEAVAEAGRRQQLAYRRLGANPDWEAGVTAAIPTELRSAYDANLAATTIRRRLAQQAAAAAITAPSTEPTITASTDPPPTEPPPPITAPTLPAWTIRAPKPAAELLGYYREAEAATGVPWPYLAAINLIETRMGRIVGVSTAAAEGPMQFLPTTWAACCQGDVWDDHDAILGAATYLAMSGAPGDMAAALWQYNPNEVYVEMVTRYAEVMATDERAYLGYHAWEVFYGTPAGDVRLPEGYTAAEPIDAAAYLAANPQDRA